MAGKRLGFLINPIAGMGGAVGLKGTDGALLEKAREYGAEPLAAMRASLTLEAMVGRLEGTLVLLTAQGAMGAEAAESAGFKPTVVYQVSGSNTTADDTRRAAIALADSGIELLLFAGGDGTARNLLESVGGRAPLLGIPCGVKMHSAVFAATPRAAADVVSVFLAAKDPAGLLEDAEVMDRESDDPGRVGSPALYGFVRTPQVAKLVTPAKAGPSDKALLDGACHYVAGLARDNYIWLLGPGTTLQRVKAELGFTGTLLGVDAVSGGRLIERDLDERGILRLITGREARIVVSVVGGQGFLFGRGNQQLSATVIRRVGKDNIIVIASPDKLATLAGGGLLVDTGDEALDEELAGYLPVITGARRRAMVRLRSLARETVALRNTAAADARELGFHGGL